MSCGIVVFPGSNCDHDVYHLVKHVLGGQVRFLWHGDATLRDCDYIVLPGGFSYGDYLRAGALASVSPIVGELRRHVESGGPVLGICNGFQILLEMGLLPGALVRNENLRFVCREVSLKVERTDLVYTEGYEKGQVLTMPIAHAEGRYVARDEDIESMEKNRQVVFRYCDADGGVGEESNPNGSMSGIAGICNAEGNVLGMMPHPERCAMEMLGSEDGVHVFSTLVRTYAKEVLS